MEDKFSIEVPADLTWPRGAVFVSEPDRPGWGTSRRWRRTINGQSYSFNIVTMPSGEVRWFVERYNGYPDARFGCAWTRYREWTFPDEYKSADADHAPVITTEGDAFECDRCGLAVTADGRRHGHNE